MNKTPKYLRTWYNCIMNNLNCKHLLPTYFKYLILIKIYIYAYKSIPSYNLYYYLLQMSNDERVTHIIIFINKTK